MPRLHNLKVGGIAVALSVMTCAAGTAGAAPPTERQAMGGHGQEWRLIAGTAQNGADAMPNGVQGPQSEAWKGGLFPVLFLTESKGDIGSEIATRTGFSYDVHSLPDRMLDVLVYADADELASKPLLARESFRLARMNGWPVVLESKSGNARAVRSTIAAAIAGRGGSPQTASAVSIQWRNGSARIAPTSSHAVESELLGAIALPDQNAGGSQAKYAHDTPKLPPNYTTYFAAAAFIDSDHVDTSRGKLDHAYYSNPQNYINYIFGDNVWTLAANDESRHWDLWKTVATSNDDKGYPHPSKCMVAWRGTQLRFSNEIDLITDLASILTFDELFPNETAWSLFGSKDPRGGRGFINMLKGQRAKIHYQLLKNNCAYTEVTGHSMGGAMAQQFGTELWSAWFNTGNGGYLWTKLVKDLRPGRTTATFTDPYGNGNDLSINVLRASRFPYLGRMLAWNPIAPAGATFRQYNNEVMKKPPNVSGIPQPTQHIYCRENDLAFKYGKSGWVNVGSSNDTYGCDSRATAGDSGTSFSAKRKNHSIRLWFGL